MLTPERLEAERQRLEAFYKLAAKSPRLRWLTGASRTYYESTADMQIHSHYRWKLNDTILVKSSAPKRIMETATIVFAIGACALIFIDTLWIKILVLALAGLISLCIIMLFKPFSKIPVVLKIGKEGIQHAAYPRPVPWHHFVGGWIKTVEGNEDSAHWLILHYYDEVTDSFLQTEIPFTSLKDDPLQLAIWIESFKKGITP